MEKIPLDFKEFLRLLNVERVEYLLIGGYAVGHYGFPRATADMDIWIAIHPDTAKRMVSTLLKFGFRPDQIDEETFLEQGRIIRMGVPPLRIEVLNDISGVKFAECYARRNMIEIGGTPVSLISLDDLKINKRASGRYKDLEDLENLK